LFLGAILFLAPFALANDGIEKNADVFLQQERTPFEIWRQDIPDYEKRLFDRVKKINSRTIRVQNLIIASIVILLLINGSFFYYIMKRIRHTELDNTDLNGEFIKTKSQWLNISTRIYALTFQLIVWIKNILISRLPKIIIAEVHAAYKSEAKDKITPLKSISHQISNELTSDNTDRKKETLFFTLSLFIFTIFSFLLLYNKPHQLLYAIDHFFYYHQVITQIHNNGPFWGVGGNYMINGAIDFAVNANLLPSFYFASFFSDITAPVITFTILGVEVFIAIYFSCRLFFLSPRISMIAAWLAPLLLLPFTYPPMALIEPFIVTPFLITMSALSILTAALFYRVGKNNLFVSGLYSAGMFFIVSFIILSLLYYSVVFLYSVLLPCLAIFIFSSSMKERVIKFIFCSITGLLLFFIFFDYLEAFYTSNWGYLINGNENTGAGILQKTLSYAFIAAFSSIDNFFEIFTYKRLPLWKNQQFEFSFASFFLYTSLLSALFIVLTYAKNIKAPAFQLASAFLFSILSIIMWDFGNIEVVIAPYYLLMFVIGLIILSQVFMQSIITTLNRLDISTSIFRNGFHFISATSPTKLPLFSARALYIHKFVFFLVVGGVFAAFLDRYSQAPGQRMLYEYGLRPNLAINEIVERQIGLTEDTVFRGRLVSTAIIDDPSHYIPDPYDKTGKAILRNALLLRRNAESLLALKFGGDLTRSIIQDKIPVLHDNNRFTSPGIAMVERYFLSRDDDTMFVQNHNIGSFDQRLLEMIGVRFYISSEPLDKNADAIFRKKEIINQDLTLYLYELQRPNIGTYSPTHQLQFSSAVEALEIIGNPETDFRKTVLLKNQIPGTLYPAKRSEVRILGDHLSVTAASKGKSIIVLPFEFSHCIEMENLESNDENPPELIQVNLDQIGLLFNKSAHVNLRYHFTPLKPECRIKDRKEWEDLDITKLQSFQGIRWSGGFLND